MSISSQLSALQTDMGVLFDKILPAVKRYGYEIENGWANQLDCIEVDDLQIRHDIYDGPKVLVSNSFSPANNELFSIPFRYFDDMDKFIAEAKLYREYKAAETKKHDLLETEAELKFRLERIQEALASLNG